MVAGWLDLNASHQYDFSREVRIPEGGVITIQNQDSKYNTCKILTREVRLSHIIVAKLEGTKIDITPLLVDIKRQIALLNASETKQALADCEAKRLEMVRIEKEKEDLSRAAVDAEKEKNRAEFNQAEAAKLAKKATWIKEQGSERLRLGFEKGYNCEKQFTSELLASLGGEWVLDYNGDISTKDRSCPTLAALQKCDTLAGHPWVTSSCIKWLPQGYDELTEMYDREEPEGVEAIEIRINGALAYLRMG
jgi:hypothetical protein